MDGQINSLHWNSVGVWAEDSIVKFFTKLHKWFRYVYKLRYMCFNIIFYWVTFECSNRFHAPILLSFSSRHISLSLFASLFYTTQSFINLLQTKQPINGSDYLILLSLLIDWSIEYEYNIREKREKERKRERFLTRKSGRLSLVLYIERSLWCRNLVNNQRCGISLRWIFGRIYVAPKRSLNFIKAYYYYCSQIWIRSSLWEIFRIYASLSPFTVF